MVEKHFDSRLPNLCEAQTGVTMFILNSPAQDAFERTTETCGKNIV